MRSTRGGVRLEAVPDEEEEGVGSIKLSPSLCAVSEGEARLVGVGREWKEEGVERVSFQGRTGTWTVTSDPLGRETSLSWWVCCCCCDILFFWKHPRQKKMSSLTAPSLLTTGVALSLLSNAVFSRGMRNAFKVTTPLLSNLNPRGFAFLIWNLIYAGLIYLVVLTWVERERLSGVGGGKTDTISIFLFLSLLFLSLWPPLISRLWFGASFLSLLASTLLSGAGLAVLGRGVDVRVEVPLSLLHGWSVVATLLNLLIYSSSVRVAKDPSLFQHLTHDERWSLLPLLYLPLAATLTSPFSLLPLVWGCLALLPTPSSTLSSLFLGAGAAILLTS